MSAAMLENFALLAASEGGVAKLRELILSLAVRGKLVPQDPADEPASELLKRIRAEKERLVAEGKIKREKKPPQPPFDKGGPPSATSTTPPFAKGGAGGIGIADDEKPFELPEGWESVRLGSLLSKIGAGSTPLGGKEVYTSSGTKFLRSQNVWNDGLRLTDVAFIPQKIHASMAATTVVSKDILFNITGASIGRCTLVPDDFDEANVSQHVTIIRPVSAEIRRYLHLVLISSHVQQTVMDVQVGVSREGLSIAKLGQFLIPLAPLPEQSRIVAKVEVLMALCDRLEAQQGDAARVQTRWTQTALDQLAESDNAAEFARNWQALADHFDTLFATPASIDALDATLLQLAVRGKLVPQNPADEPASELLKHIRTEKDRLIAAGQIKRDKPLPLITDDEKPFELPEGWEWARTYQVAESRLGKMLDKAKNTGTAYPYLRNTNVQWNRFDLDDIKQIFLEPHELDVFRLRYGDLLVCEGGEPGRCAIWRGEKEEMYFQKALHRIRPLGGALAEYLAICFEVDAQTGRLDQFFSGATIKHFAGQELNRYFVPLPPLPEQSRIVAKLDGLLALTRTLRARLTDARTMQARLASALVDEVAA